MSFSIRYAEAEDSEHILQLIMEIAEYEKMTDEVETTAENLKKWLFGPHPAAECLIAEVDNRPVGYALFFTNFSTFKGIPGIYLEDLYVQEAYRGRGIGNALFVRVAKITNERDYGRMEWCVLNWNKPAIDFYHEHGAIAMDEWTTFRLTDAKLTQFGT